MNSVKHLALIMDGNGRWAQMRNRPRIHGHLRGTKVAKNIILHANDLGIEVLTLYAFSTENWYRPESEVSFLMHLLERYLKRETDNLVKKNIQFDTIGSLSKVPQRVRDQIEIAKRATSNCTGLKVIFALSYGSRQEITQAMKLIAQKVESGALQADDITEDVINSHLMTADIPDPDLIIRTSGEQRISNFLLWQAAYSEFYFTTKLWPDFTNQDLDIALEQFSRRSRRFGRTEAQVSV